MSKTPVLLVLPSTCLDLVEEHRSWIESQGVALHAEQRYRKAPRQQIIELLQGSDAVILPSPIRGLPTVEELAGCPRLLTCAFAASGFEALDIDAATRLGIVVSFAPGGSGAEVVAELALGLMLAVARQIPFHHQRLCAGDTTRRMGTSLFSKTLGIVGLGHVGRALAERAAGLKLRVVATDPMPDRAFAARHGVELVEMDELLERADFVSLHARLSEETRHMIGARELGLMKPSAYLINTARRELVDEAALAGAILDGRIAGAGLDDPPGPGAGELLGLPNVVFTPHIGNRAIEGAQDVFRTAVESALRAIRGQRPAHVVNPEVYVRGARRLAPAAPDGIGNEEIPCERTH